MEYEAIEKNEMSAVGFCQALNVMLGTNLSQDDFEKGWCDLYLEVYPGIDEMLRTLKSSFWLAALTNTNAIHEKVWTKKYSTSLAHFEKVFSSHQMGCRKPEKEAYKKVLDHFGVAASESIFLDDNADNVAAAMNCGITSIHVLSPEQMIGDLYLRLNISKNGQRKKHHHR